MQSQPLKCDRRPLWNIHEWIELNEHNFLPPVCNKMMHGSGQLKVFFVGGPNVRKDYHLEEGEELFYQIKGDMCLKVIERNQPKNVIIKEGEIFLLPGNVYHSPQRSENTLGLVIERERIRDKEIDGIRYFFEENDKQPSANPLYEAWFYCEDLGTQLVPVINRYFASLTGRTSSPQAHNDQNLPCHVNFELTLDAPINIEQWVARNGEEIRARGKKALFDERKWQSKVYVYGPGTYCDYKPDIEVFCLQLAGVMKIVVDNFAYELEEDDCLLIEAGRTFVIHGCDVSSRCLVYCQDPKAKAY